MRSLDRAKVIAWANEAGRESRRGGAPFLTMDSDAATLVSWLRWNDPSGEYADEDDDGNPIPLDSDAAWECLLDCAAGDL